MSVFAIGAVAGLVVGLLTPLVLRPYWKRRWEESGWAEWRRTARSLPWRDRLRLYRANMAGRAVRDRRLAGLAVRRGERLYVLAESQRREGMPRWVRFLGVGVFGGIGVLCIVAWSLAPGNPLLLLMALLFFLPVALLYGFAPAIQRRVQARVPPWTLRRIQRSIEANRALAGDPEPHP